MVVTFSVEVDAVFSLGVEVIKGFCVVSVSEEAVSVFAEIVVVVLDSLFEFSSGLQNSMQLLSTRNKFI